MPKGKRKGGGKKKSNDSTDSSAESSIMDDSSCPSSAEGLSYQLTQILVSEPVIVEEDTTIQVVSSITGLEANTTTEEKVAPVVCVPSAGDVETSLVSLSLTKGVRLQEHLFSPLPLGVTKEACLRSLVLG